MGLKASTICLHLVLSWAACCTLAYLLQLSCQCTLPGCFMLAMSPFSRCCPSKGNLGYMVLFHSEYMPKPSNTATYDFQHYNLALCFHVQSFIRGLYRSEDATFSLEASIMEGIDLVYITFYYLPAFNIIARLVWYCCYIFLPFVLMLYCFDCQIGWSLANELQAFPSLALISFCFTEMTELWLHCP